MIYYKLTGHNFVTSGRNLRPRRYGYGYAIIPPENRNPRKLVFGGLVTDIKDFGFDRAVLKLDPDLYSVEQLRDVAPQYEVHSSLPIGDYSKQEAETLMTARVLFLATFAPIRGWVTVMSQIEVKARGKITEAPLYMKEAFKYMREHLQPSNKVTMA
ncbi:hypothetical protein BDP27DRAFT_1361828 [Rhodocollybia butyracea]|uniref:Uncharacterized protein n=1 Tax=Rhodocollybia butyracea TaxID=206335 RepID=A0A9P5PYA4_9AGAR|nr:hypothetical protein BDP27DRAFT_1361828 [Rhodocollybia butyracea]